MATWRFEIEEKHAIVRTKLIEADSEDAARALAEAEVAEGFGTWDELYDYTDCEITSTLEMDERGCPWCASSDLTFDRSCAGCGQPWPRTPEEWQIAYEEWLAAHRAEHPQCTCDYCVAAQAARLTPCPDCGARGVTIFERTLPGTSGIFYCCADEAHFSVVPGSPQPPTPHLEGWKDANGYWVQLQEGEHTRDVYGPYPDPRTATVKLTALEHQRAWRTAIGGERPMRNNDTSYDRYRQAEAELSEQLEERRRAAEEAIQWERYRQTQRERGTLDEVESRERWLRGSLIRTERKRGRSLRDARQYADTVVARFRKALSVVTTANNIENLRDPAGHTSAGD